MSSAVPSAAGSEHHREPAVAASGDGAAPEHHATPGRLLLLRHGETEWSAAGRHTGNTDVALTARGEAQARAASGLLRDLPIARVLSSPLQRAVRTAQLAGASCIEIDPALVEWDYGEYEGLTRAQIRERDPGWTIWTGALPGGETAGQVRERAGRVLDRLRPMLAHGDVLVVGHGHLSRVLATLWLQLPVSAGAVLYMEPASLCVLGDDRDQPVLQRWNLPPGPTASGPAR